MNSRKRAQFSTWFWERPLFRNLQPRLMTMILALVLPVSLICLALSIVSVYQSARSTYAANQNAFSMYIDQIALRQELGDIDILQDFPASLAQGVKILYWDARAENPSMDNGASVYVSQGGQEAFLVHQDGTWESTEDSFETLKQARYQYLWEKPDHPFRVLVTFPYNFALRNVPAWFWAAIVISLLMPASCVILHKRLCKDVLEPMETMRIAQTALAQDRTYRIPPHGEEVIDDFRSLFDDFNRMAKELQRSHEKDVKLLETEMDNLRLQINPHMLLNSYNMIYALAESKNYATIQDYTLCLVDYFRYVLRRGQQQVTVRQELDFVENFIRIQKIRFPGRFSYVYQAGEDCLDALIPPLLIENFVENAIKYALKPDEPIEIVVSLHTEETEAGEKNLHISIMDTGSGIRPEVLAALQAQEPYVDAAGHKHIGIWNSIRRIELFYREAGSVHFSSAEGAGTQAYMVIPCIYGKTDKEART